MITSYILGHMVDHGCDNLVESFVVHSSSVGKVERSYLEKLVSFLIFLSNVFLHV